MGWVGREHLDQLVLVERDRHHHGLVIPIFHFPHKGHPGPTNGETEQQFSQRDRIGIDEPVKLCVTLARSFVSASAGDASPEWCWWSSDSSSRLSKPGRMYHESLTSPARFSLYAISCVVASQYGRRALVSLHCDSTSAEAKAKAVRSSGCEHHRLGLQHSRPRRQDSRHNPSQHNQPSTQGPIQGAIS